MSDQNRAGDPVLESYEERLRRALALAPADADRLTYANAKVSVAIPGVEQLVLHLDEATSSVSRTDGPCEIELELDSETATRFFDGQLVLQRALAEGGATASGPVWKFLRVTPILAALLEQARISGASLPDGAPTPVAVSGTPAGQLAAIECCDLWKRFDSDEVLTGVDLIIPEGLISVIIGPSGTGKSVLLKHIIGLLRPDAGRVLVRGRALDEMSTRELMRLRRQFGVLFQDGALWAGSTVGENVAFPLRQHTDLSEQEIQAIVADRLHDVGLADAWHLLPRQLSGGMRKRAGLARAITLEPEIILFDEPDSGLDPVRTALLCGLIAEIHARYGGTFIVVTHDISVLRQIGHYVAVLWRGKIVEQGHADQVLGSDDPFVRQFLSGEVDGPLAMD